jgi:hypothetical protein
MPKEGVSFYNLLRETAQIRSTVAKGIKRLFLLQLCTIFFDKDN